MGCNNSLKTVLDDLKPHKVALTDLVNTPVVQVRNDYDGAR